MPSPFHTLDELYDALHGKPGFHEAITEYIAEGEPDLPLCAACGVVIGAQYHVDGCPNEFVDHLPTPYVVTTVAA